MHNSAWGVSSKGYGRRDTKVDLSIGTFFCKHAMDTIHIIIPKPLRFYKRETGVKGLVIISSEKKKAPRRWIEHLTL